MGCSDHNGRRAGNPRRRVPARRARAASGDPHLRPVRQGPGVPGGLSRPVAAHGRRAPRRRARVEQPVSELGDRRPGEVGPRRVRLRAGGLARRGPLPRLPRPVLPARGPRPLRVRRVGRRPAVEHRQGRHQRHLLLRDERLARGRPAAAAPGRDLRLGGRRGLLPGRHPPRRHPVLVLPPLVRQAGHRGPARDRRPAQRGHRGAGGGAGNLHSSRTGGRAGPVRRADRRAPAGRGVLRRPVRALGPDHRAPADRRQLGRPGPAHPGQLRGLRPCRLGAQVAGGARPRALDPLLHRLRCRPAETVLRLLPAGGRLQVAGSAPGPATGPHPRRFHSAFRTTVAAGQDPLDQAVSVAGQEPAEHGAAGCRQQGVLPGGLRRGHVHRAAAGGRDRDHRAGRGAAVRVVHHGRRGPVLRAAGAGAGRVRRHVPRRDRSAHPGRPGLAAGLAPQARSGPVHRIPAVPRP